MADVPAAEPALPPAELIITLPTPVIAGGEPWQELKLREPTCDEIIKIATLSGMAATKELMRLITGWPAGAIGQLGVSVIKKADRYLEGFIVGVVKP